MLILISISYHDLRDRPTSLPLIFIYPHPSKEANFCLKNKNFKRFQSVNTIFVQITDKLYHQSAVS